MITKKNYQLHEKDTGSTAVQIISLREEINKEKSHLGKNKKDVPTKRALLKKLAKERKFFKYLFYERCVIDVVLQHIRLCDHLLIFVLIQ